MKNVAKVVALMLVYSSSDIWEVVPTCKLSYSRRFGTLRVPWFFPRFGDFHIEVSCVRLHLSFSCCIGYYFLSACPSELVTVCGQWLFV